MSMTPEMFCIECLILLKLQQNAKEWNEKRLQNVQMFSFVRDKEKLCGKKIRC